MFSKYSDNENELEAFYFGKQISFLLNTETRNTSTSLIKQFIKFVKIVAHLCQLAKNIVLNEVYKCSSKISFKLDTSLQVPLV